MKRRNVSGPEQGIPKYFTQALKSESFSTSQLRLLAEVSCRNEHAKAMLAVFWIDEVCFRYKLFDGQMTRPYVLGLNWHNVEADTCIV